MMRNKVVLAALGAAFVVLLISITDDNLEPDSGKQQAGQQAQSLADCQGHPNSSFEIGRTIYGCDLALDAAKHPVQDAIRYANVRYCDELQVRSASWLHEHYPDRFGDVDIAFAEHDDRIDRCARRPFTQQRQGEICKIWELYYRGAEPCDSVNPAWLATYLELAEAGRDKGEFGCSSFDFYADAVIQATLFGVPNRPVDLPYGDSTDPEAIAKKACNLY